MGSSHNSSYFERDLHGTFKLTNHKDRGSFKDSSNSKIRSSFVESKKNANLLFGALNQKSKKQHSPRPISDEENEYDDKANLSVSQRKANLKRRLQAQGPKGNSFLTIPIEDTKSCRTQASTSKSSNNAPLSKSKSRGLKTKASKPAAVGLKPLGPKQLNRLVTMTEIGCPNEVRPTLETPTKKLVILRDKLSKRAKLKLDLENIIKALRDPSTYLKHIRVGCEDTLDEEIRVDLLFYAEAVKDEMNNRKKSLDVYFNILKRLYHLDENFTGSQELFLYLQKLIKITHNRVEKLYNKRQRRLRQQRDRSRDSPFSSQKQEIRNEKDIELKLMDL